MLFVSGLLFLVIRSRLSSWSDPGWHRFRGFLWLTILWNVVTFAGHQMELGIGEEDFLREAGRVTGFRIETASQLLFYLSKLDHLLLLPALVLLMLALKQWIAASEREP